MPTAHPTALALCLAAGTALQAAATVSPFTETFDADSANFLDAGFGDLTFVADGDSGFVRNTLSADAEGDMGLVVARAEVDARTPENTASGGAFTGDYIASGITQFSFDVRHDADAALEFSARFSPTARFPGAFPLAPQSVAPSLDFTTVTFAISLAQLGFEGAPTQANFEAVFQDVANIQLFLQTDLSTAASSAVNIDFDNVAISNVPEPTTLAVAGLGGLALCQRRRRA